MPRPIHLPASAQAVPRLALAVTPVRGVADQGTHPAFGYNNPVTMCFDVEPSVGYAVAFSCVETSD